MKKICFVTAARSEYGLLKWLMKDTYECKDFEFQLIVTGAHLSYNQGHTIDYIIADGFQISEIVNVELDTSTEAQIASSMGLMSQGFAKAFEKLKPDYLLVLGDRYELLPICSTALVMRIPIIHLSGGDITEGVIDDNIRNAITMMADYHFPGTKESKNSIIRMRNSKENVWDVGEPGLDSFFREKLLTRKELACDLNFDMNKKWVLMTYHPETKKSVDINVKNVKACIDALLEIDDCEIVITHANTDFGGLEINNYIAQMGEKYSDKIKVIASLGQLRYLSFMKQTAFVIGNSSSGIVEAPFLNIPVINVGERQKGRYQCGNVNQCSAEKDIIIKIINKILIAEKKEYKDLFYWGDGHTSTRILNILRSTLR